MHEPKASSYQWNKLALRTRYCRAKEKKKHRERAGFVFGNIRTNWYSQSLQAIRLKQTCDQEVRNLLLILTLTE